MAAQPAVLGIHNPRVSSSLCLAQSIGLTQFVCQGNSISTRSSRAGPYPNREQDEGVHQVARPSPTETCSGHEAPKEGEGRAHRQKERPTKARAAKENTGPPSDKMKLYKYNRGMSNAATNGSQWSRIGIRSSNAVRVRDNQVPMASHPVEQTLPETVTDSRVSPNDTSLTLRPSASGNNINLSCTIDRRLFVGRGQEQRSDVGLRWSLVANRPKTTGPSSDMFAIDAVANENDTVFKAVKSNHSSENAPEEVHSKDSIPDEGIDSGRISPKITNVGVNVRRFLSQNTPSYTPNETFHSVSAPPDLPRLSNETMLLFDHHSRLSDSERRQLIEAWIGDVNDARCMHYTSAPPPSERTTVPSSKDGKDFIEIPTARPECRKTSVRGLKSALVGSNKIPLMVCPESQMVHRLLGNTSSSSRVGRHVWLEKCRVELTDDEKTGTKGLGKGNELAEPHLRESARRMHSLPNRSVYVRSGSGRYQTGIRYPTQDEGQANGLAEPSKKLKRMINNYVLPRASKMSYQTDGQKGSTTLLQRTKRTARLITR